MGRRVSRLYAWREIQELARDLQTLYHGSSSQPSEEHRSRIVRVERIKMEQDRARLEIQAEALSASSKQFNFDAQDFKTAWKNRQVNVSSCVESSSSQLDESTQGPARDNSTPSQAQNDDQRVTAQRLDKTQEGSASPWELLRDHFLEQHRLHKEQKNKG